MGFLEATQNSIRLYHTSAERCLDSIMTSILNVNAKPQSIEQAIQAAIAQARETCNTDGSTSSSCAVAWDIVEELQAERSHRVQVKTAFERYCDENPNADECRVYDV